MENNAFYNTKNIWSYTPKVLRLLYNIDRKNFIYISILYLVLGLFPSVSILSTQWLINSIQLSGGKNINLVMMPLFVYIFINVITALTSMKLNYIQSKFKLDLQYYLQTTVLNKTKELDMKDFENPSIYDKLERIDGNSSNMLFESYSSIFSMIREGITIVTSVVILLSWNIWVVFPIILISIASSVYMSALGQKRYKIDRERASDSRKLWYYNYLLTKDTSYKEIKLYNLQEYFLDKYKEIYIQFLKQDKWFVKLTYIVTFIFSMIEQIVSAVISFMIIKAAFYGEILIGSTISYIRCISTLQLSIQSFLGMIVEIYKNGLYIGNIFEFLEVNNDKKDSNVEEQFINSIDTIEFKNVSFKYPSRKTYSIKDISFKVDKGDKVAIVGLNGSGKTTIVKLLCGFYSEYEGNILINNIEIRDIDKDSLRKNIAAIFQDYIKYELSLKENIHLGNIEDLDNENLVNKILNKIGGEDLKKSLPNGIYTQLGVWFDDGVQLSGGQWQKISLMRAYYRDADCYILDEPNSALDPISESEVFENICEMTNEKIGFLITHKMININKFASKVIVLNNGKIVECGSHENLMNNKSYYYTLYMKQFNDNKKYKEGRICII